MENTFINTSNYFSDFINSFLIPTFCVYSTEKAKKISSLNNLKPSELLRPFGNFQNYNFNFSLNEKYNLNIKNFKIDFYDSEKYKKFPFSSINEILENVLLKNAPDWNLNSVNFYLIFLYY